MSEFPSKEQFREWLAAKEPDEVVDAETNRSEQCPLARCLRDNGFPSALMVTDHWFPETCGRSQRAPNWAWPFVFKFDEASRDSLDPLTAKQALTILDDLDVFA